MNSDYKMGDFGSSKIAIIDLLTETGEEEYSDILNNSNHWVRPDDIQIISHERSGAIYAVIKYYVLKTEGVEAPSSLSPRAVIKRMNEIEDEKQIREMEKNN
jgi:hypothetical protein